MNELFSKIQPKLDENRNWDYSNYMTEHFPRRISGMGDDRRASEWIVEKFRSFGLEAEIAEYTAYNSNPVGSFVKVLEPETVTLESRPCCHISSTPLEGVELELLYLGAGDYRDYEGKDVRGKAVLVEVSYSPATPEKARIAYEHGAAAMVCANWGEDGKTEQDYICGRGLKSVWGNPTPETWKDIPQIIGVSLTHSGGIYLRTLCEKNEHVKVNISSQATRSWDVLPFPVGFLRGSEEPEKYLLVNGHIDAWEPGVTCNATGDGTIITLAEQLAKLNFKRSKLGRNCIAIREEPLAAAACGIDVFRHKLLAMAISCALCGLSGALLAHYMHYLVPTMFNMAKSNELIMTAILGGRGSITGTLIAGAVLIPLPEFLRFGSAQEWRMVLYGLLVVITIIFRPTGLVGGKEITPKAIRQFGMQMRQRLHRMNGVVRKGDGEHE